MVNVIKYLAFQNSFRKICVVAFFMMSMISFGQESEVNSIVENNETTEATNSIKADVTKTANYNFVLWFMGAKQNPINNTTSEFNNTKINPKNQIMTSGLAPNRLLIKAFLKKAVNFETCFV